MQSELVEMGYGLQESQQNGCVAARDNFVWIFTNQGLLQEIEQVDTW